MPGLPDGIERFQDSVHPDVLRDITTWASDPELGKIHTELRGSADASSFADSLAEAQVARLLAAAGCALRFEVPTPAGRTCDFEINADGDPVYLHVKRLDTDRPAQRQLTVSSHLRYLERIRRPYIVRLRWHDGLDDVTMQRFVTDCARFIQIARVGDEHIVRDDAGREIGGCLIAAPWEGTHVTLAIGLPTGFVDDAPRMHRLLRKAYLQFMPRATNVIMLGTSRDEDVVDFEEALLGTHIERWDRHPPKGRRIAHGRDDDGFWHRRRFAASEAVVWFRSRPQEAVIHPRLWLREDAHLPAPHVALLRRLFGEPETHGAGTL